MSNTDDDFSKKVGARIRAARQSAGMTQRELARKAGIDEPAISKYESGKVGFGYDKALDMARALGVDIHAFDPLNGEAPPAKVESGPGTGKTMTVAVLLQRLADREGVSLSLDLPNDAQAVDWQVHLAARIDDLALKLAETNEMFAKFGESVKTRESRKPGVVLEQIEVRRR